MSNREGTVFILGTGLDTHLGIMTPYEGWLETSLPESASWPERVWAELARTYESLEQNEGRPPSIYHRDGVVCVSPVGWSGLCLYGTLFETECPDCGEVEPIRLPVCSEPECECGSIRVPAIRTRPDETTLRIVEEMVAAAERVVMIGVSYDPIVHELIQNCADISFYGGLEDIEGWPPSLIGETMSISVGLRRFR